MSDDDLDRGAQTEDLAVVVEANLRLKRATTLLTWVLIVHGVIRFSEHISAEGQDVFGHACNLGAEGIVSKGMDAPQSATFSIGFNPFSAERIASPMEPPSIPNLRISRAATLL
jgi:hypothetical protein